MQSLATLCWRATLLSARTKHRDTESKPYNWPKVLCIAKLLTQYSNETPEILSKAPSGIHAIFSENLQIIRARYQPVF